LRPSQLTPCAPAPSTKRPRKASIASSERFRLIARRSPSASPIEKPASAVATSSTWSWKTITPSVSRSGSSNSGWSLGGTNEGVIPQPLAVCDERDGRRRPGSGPGRTSATWIVRSSRFSGRVCSSDCICARLSIWKTPMVSAAWISP
jgi:hypothetical protein